ncbi:TetR/AcrR family transcriptional regulator [Micromonospora sp. CPCC 206061]|uniref:TetR/AcrR family transcriptional regulator n=1 Tax=Micromonospora sp. CPCC 206061 TaxID=3122410 RepID=UPI002FEE8E91
MARLTRHQQQELTHERLLVAGRSVFLRRGYLAATVEEIASEAGYTRGALYKHFGGKEGLWQSIVEARARTHLELLGAALDRATSRDDLVAALDPSAIVSDGEATRWTAAAAEHLAAVTGHPRQAEPLADLQRRLDDALTALLTQHCGRLGIQPAVPLARLVVVLGALGGGLALRRVLDPSVDTGTVTADLLALALPAAVKA